MDSITAQMGRLQVQPQLPDAVVEIQWLDNTGSAQSRSALTIDKLCSWIRADNQQLGPIRPTQFCSPELINRLVDVHQQHASYTEKQRAEVASWLNMSDLLGKHFFTTRTGLKCAELDTLLQFTRPQRMTADGSGEPLATGQLLSYADITDSDDTGVTEYMQWRCGDRSIGYTFDNPARQSALWRNARPDGRPSAQMRCSVRSDKLAHEPAKMREFVEFVRGEELLRMGEGEGGVLLAISEDLQQPKTINGLHENYVKHQALAYSALCLALLAPGGTMCVKIEETYTDFTVGLLWLLSRCFKQMAIHKLQSSRATNGERHLVMRGRLSNVDDDRLVGRIVEHLMHLNESMANMVATGGDIQQLVPFDVICADEVFLAYIRQCNERLAERQTMALQARLAVLQQYGGAFRQPRDHRMQADRMQQKWHRRVALLQQWQLPLFDAITAPAIYYKRLMRGSRPFGGLDPDVGEFTRSVELFSQSEGMLDEWFFGPVARSNLVNEPSYYLSMGTGQLWKWLSEDAEWSALLNVTDVHLPEGTVVYGAEVLEYGPEDGAKLFRLHLIDVICLRFHVIKFDILVHRRQLLKRFTDESGGCLIMGDLYPISEFLPFVRRARTNWKQFGQTKSKCLSFRSQSGGFFAAAGIGFYRLHQMKFIESRPLFWDWSQKPHALLNDDCDAPTHFSWFEKRLHRLASRRQSRPTGNHFRSK